MKKRTQPFSLIALAALVSIPAHAAIVVTTTQAGNVDPGPTVSDTDLAQTEFGSSSATGGNGIGASQAYIFNGTVGDIGTGTGEAPTATDANTVTLNLDTTVNTLGYDITGIDTVFGWNPGANGRSNQGYSITVGFVGGGTATLVNAQHWEPNSPAQFWTVVSFAEDGGGTLFSDTVNLNGGGAVADEGTLATGVNSITWDISNNAAAGGVVVLREFDVFGAATVPEPGVTLLGSLGLLGLLRRRR